MKKKRIKSKLKWREVYDNIAQILIYKSEGYTNLWICNKLKISKYILKKAVNYDVEQRKLLMEQITNE
jgi:hypothetical protein